MDNERIWLISDTFTEGVLSSILRGQPMPNCVREYRCKSCHKLFFKGLLVEGAIEVKCKHCHEVNTIQASQLNELLCLIKDCPNRISWDSQKESP